MSNVAPFRSLGRPILVGISAALVAFLAATALGTASASASRSLIPSGSLIPSASGEALGPVAVSGDSVFAGAPHSTFVARDEGAIFVFGKPSGGWSGSLHETAVLTAASPTSGGRLGGSLSASGSTVAASSSDGKVYVFTQPAGGWSGVVHQAAVLSASDGATLSNPVISGQTVFAKGTAGSGSSVVYVFAEPAGGWSGTLHEVGKLVASDDSGANGLGASISVAGATVVAGAPTATVGSNRPGAVYVFTEPGGGWTGTVHETAKLTGSDLSSQSSRLPVSGLGSAVQISGNTILAALPISPGASGGAVYVFTQPGGGWNSETESAKLVPHGSVTAGSPFFSGGLAISGGTVVVSGSQGSTLGSPAEFVFTEPGGGWSGTQSESATLVASDNQPLGAPIFSGNSVIAGQTAGGSSDTIVGMGPVYVFNQPGGGWSGRLTESARLAGAGGAPPGGSDYLFSEPSGGWTSGSESATLVPSGNPDQINFSSASADGSTVVASGNGSAYVFSEPRGGWASSGPVARLLDSGAAQLRGATISGGTVAVLAGPSANAFGSSPAIDVFTRPASGWSGAAQQVATLRASNGDPFSAIAISGETVVATSGCNSVYVFTEPPGGWSGSQHETARLRVPPGICAASVGIDRRTIIAGGAISGSTVVSTGAAYAFTERPSGWSARPTVAKLTPFWFQQGALQVYTQPRRGWSATVRPSARLLMGASAQFVSGLTTNGHVISAAAYATTGNHEQCPCPGGVWAFGEPKRGWSGVLSGAPSASANTDADGSTALAVDGMMAFAGGQTITNDFGQTALGIFRLTQPIAERSITPGRPKITRLHLSGLLAGRPRLAFTIHAGSNAAPIRSFTVRLPRGLAFNRNSRTRSRAVLVNGVTYRTRLLRGRLSETVNAPLSELVIQIRPAALADTGALRRRLRRLANYNRAHRHQRTLRLKVIIRAIDATGHRAQFSPTATIR